MLIAERHRKLLAILRERKAAQLEDLARALDVSGSTVRRDLEALEQQGHIERTHGGAVYRERASNGQTSLALAARMQANIAAKQAIGKCVADQVQPNMTLLLDGGSTVIYAARQIVARPLQVVTNSLSIANHFADDEQVELLLIGGSLYPRSGVLVGPIAIGCLADLHADLLLFSLAGLYDDAAYNINLTMAQVEQVMMQQAARSIMLMDSSKFGRKSLVRVCAVDDVDQIVTDTAVDDEWRDRLTDRLTIAE
ncbi:DeoR/GlpR family DNA-binding transcription regulator [Phycisphaerales bacterium AB-hyl4]|uniref:DeoR/GlpR family DNA-binding transcription regulator n=1 Tax=Natronomicrosphaera hydrolytica TaxID=3242702 RepID=A0ABV4U832_9BACT